MVRTRIARATLQPGLSNFEIQPTERGGRGEASFANLITKERGARFTRFSLFSSVTRDRNLVNSSRIWPIVARHILVVGFDDSSDRSFKLHFIGGQSDRSSLHRYELDFEFLRDRRRFDDRFFSIFYSSLLTAQKGVASIPNYKSGFHPLRNRRLTVFPFFLPFFFPPPINRYPTLSLISRIIKIPKRFRPESWGLSHRNKPRVIRAFRSQPWNAALILVNLLENKGYQRANRNGGISWMR